MSESGRHSNGRDNRTQRGCSLVENDHQIPSGIR